MTLCFSCNSLQVLIISVVIQ